MKESTTKLAPYRTSRDYERLLKLMEEHSIICVVDFYGMKPNDRPPVRDVCRTVLNFDGREGAPVFNVWSRGIGHISTDCKLTFVADCKAVDLEFLDPGESIKI